MLKIGIACFPTYGGSGAIATELGMYMARKGHDVHFISSQKPFRLKSGLENVYFHPVKTKPYPVFSYPLYSFALASEMKEVAENYKLDLFHVHYALPHTISAYLAKIISSRKPKIITTLHGTDIHLIGLDPGYFPLVKFGLEVSDGVTAVSRYLKKVTEEKFCSKCDIKLIPNFINPEYLKRKSVNRKHDKVILHISNFRPIKRTLDVIKVFNIVRQKTDTRLLMAGDGPDKHKCIELAHKLKLTRHITFLGNQKNITEIFSRSDILILPSENESFGLTALEAMACEVPVIASNAGGLPEVIKDCKTGYLLPVGDIKGMAKKAIELLEHPEKRKKMGALGRMYAIKNFSIEKIGAEYERYYRSFF
ncbi:MAG: N-acetyl-alpha-D-glucosaminyl L-malate synthase BshA [bacterium]